MRAKRRSDGVPEEVLEALALAVAEGQRLRSGAAADAEGEAAEAAEFLRCAEEEAAGMAGAAAAAAAAAAALPGRTTGSLEWRAARGELGAAAAATAAGGSGGGGGGGGGGAACATAAPDAGGAACATAAPEAPQAALKRMVHAHFSLLTVGCAAAAGACSNENCAKGPSGPAKSANEAAVRALALAREGAEARC